MKLLITLLSALIIIQSFANTYYIDAIYGNDNNEGKSPETAWQTIERVNIAELVPGDSVLFRRGQIFRGNLVVASGMTDNYITYGAYGSGNKPKIFGSSKRNSALDWVNEGGNIWSTVQTDVTTTGSELLPNPDFDFDLSNWALWNNTENGASSVLSRTTIAEEYYSSPGGGKLECITKGSNMYDIQLTTFSWPVTLLKWYKFSFKAKSTQPFTIDKSYIKLQQIDSPWEGYAALTISDELDILTTWTTYEILFKTNKTGSDCSFTLCLGDIIPDGAIFYFDSLSFMECFVDPAILPVDVGNIIFNDESFCGTKVWEESDLNTQGKFWYDEENDLLKLYSSSNPALYYSNIELALYYPIIDINFKSYIIFENLDLRYGAVHGISGMNTDHIWIRDVDISYIGGGDQLGGSGTGRLGNGIQYWNAAHDNIVERCTFDQIYDAAMSPQGRNPEGFEVYNLYFINNIVRNAEFSFEFWEQDESITVHDVYFENNTCINAGYGWGHEQRPDLNGTHLMFYSNPSNTYNFYVRNNIFFNTSDYGVTWLRAEDVNKIIIDYNCWYEISGWIALLEDRFFNYATDWETYRSASGQDVHSIAADPLLNTDYTLQDNSPCINAGLTISTVTNDYNGEQRPIGSKYDIGAFESNVITSIENNLITSEACIHPNPVNNTLTFVTEAEQIPGKLIIYNSNGQEIITKQIDQVKTEIDLSNLVSGLYFVKFNGVIITETNKIIIM